VDYWNEKKTSQTIARLLANTDAVALRPCVQAASRRRGHRYRPFFGVAGLHDTGRGFGAAVGAIASPGTFFDRYGLSNLHDPLVLVFEGLPALALGDAPPLSGDELPRRPSQLRAIRTMTRQPPSNI
jgi:hypothetical protein